MKEFGTKREKIPGDLRELLNEEFIHKIHYSDNIGGGGG
jgi:hypothetical protein